MIFLARLCARVRWLNSAAGVLLVLLQRTPVVRALVTVESALAAPAASLLRALVPAAALGVVDSMAGASTTLVANVNQPAKATVGSPFSETVVIQGLGVSFAQSWTIGNTLQPGITPQGATLSGGRWAINPSGGSLTLSGTPTTAGTYSISVSGYQFTNFGAPVTTATATIVVSPAPNSAPAITRPPGSVTVLTGGSVTFTINFTGTPAPTFQWLKNGVAIPGATNATLPLSNIALADAGSYSVALTNSLGSATSAAATLTVTQAPVAPSIVTAPVAQTVVAGNAVQFTVNATGTPTPTLQWLKDGVAIDGATDATLTLPSVQLTDAGQYSVLVSNSQGAVTSAAALLTVTPAAAAPVFSSPPVSQTVAAGATVVFNAPAIASPAPTYSWLLNGQTIPNATGPTLMIPRVSAADAGAYTAVAQNSLGLQTSPAAALIVATTHNPGRLTNLSVLTSITPAVQTFTVATVIGGAGTSGTKPIVVRLVGPSLAAITGSSAGLLPTPKLDLFLAQTAIVSNNSWGGGTTLTNAMASVGAFAFISPTSADAAVFQPSLAPGSYSVIASGVNGATGLAIAEIYDATPASTFTATTPRLINVSVLKQIDAGGSLTLGFTISGTTAKTVLIRAIGPGLAAVGLTSGTLADPQLTLFDASSNSIALNNDWGGDASLVQANASVGAFAISNPASKDAMLLRTLPAGGYTATVTGLGGTGGLAIVEVYEVP